MNCGAYHGFFSRRALAAGAALGVFLAEVGAQATEGAAPLAPGRLRLDVDAYSGVRDRIRPAEEGGRLSSDAWAWLQLGAGVCERVEARIGWQSHHRERSGGVVTEGAGDLWLMAKIALAGDESVGGAWAVMPFAKLPTAGARWADDTFDAGLLLIHGRPLGEDGFFNAQFGGEDHGDGAGGRDQGLCASFVAGRPLGPRWTIYAEAIAELYPRNGDSGAFTPVLGAGLARAGDEAGSWGIDLAAYGGLNRAAPDMQAVLRFWLEWGAAGRRAPVGDLQ